MIDPGFNSGFFYRLMWTAAKAGSTAATASMKFGSVIQAFELRVSSVLNFVNLNFSNTFACPNT